SCRRSASSSPTSSSPTWGGITASSKIRRLPSPPSSRTRQPSPSRSTTSTYLPKTSKRIEDSCGAAYPTPRCSTRLPQSEAAVYFDIERGDLLGEGHQQVPVQVREEVSTARRLPAKLGAEGAG